jgi:hypothetical protein
VTILKLLSLLALSSGVISMDYSPGFLPYNVIAFKVGKESNQQAVVGTSLLLMLLLLKPNVRLSMLAGCCKFFTTPNKLSKLLLAVSTVADGLPNSKLKWHNIYNILINRFASPFVNKRRTPRAFFTR